MLQHFAPKVAAAAASRHRALALTPKLFRRAERVCVDTLKGGKVETRGALYAALEKAGIATTKSRGMHIMWQLAHEGLLCYGPRSGKQPTFTLLDEWVPSAASLDRPAALIELARRYFRSHGPAQAKDFAWWGGITLGEARLAIEGAGLRSDVVDGNTFWSDASERLARSGSRVVAHLLPLLDEYTVAYRDRSAVLSAADTLRVNAGGGLIKPIIVIDGRVRGTWRRLAQVRGMTVTLTQFGRFTRAEHAALKAAQRKHESFWSG
jgi:hypothetical protein